MHNQLDRIIKLVKKTGDRMVVLDHDNPRQSYVVMDIDEYERLVDCCGIGGWKEDEDEDGEDEEDYEGYGDKLWREDREDEDWDFKAEDIFKDKADEFGGLADSESDFNEPPIIDDEAGRWNEKEEDFTPIDEILAEKQGRQWGKTQLDNNSEYGTMEHNSREISNKKRGRWEIPLEVKKIKEEGAPDEEDRYYLETI